MSGQPPPPLGPPPGGAPEPELPSDQRTGLPGGMNRRAFAGALVAVVAALAVVAVAFGVTMLGDDGIEDPTREPPPANLSDVEIYQDLSTEHVTDDVDYPQVPPVGGEHDEAWHECGVFDDPVRDENMVHSLEHGTVWVTYLPGLSADEIDQVVDQLPDDSIVSPYPDQDAPVVVTVWGAQLALEGVDDPRLRLFVDEYGDGHTSPEPMVTCNGGVMVSEDGTSGSDA